MKRISFLKASALALAYIVLPIVLIVLMYIQSNTICAQTHQQDKYDEYKEYCDSIYEHNPDYYLDVLVESDEYQEYINEHNNKH